MFSWSFPEPVLNGPVVVFLAGPQKPHISHGAGATM
jgi:hypothetical protein